MRNSGDVTAYENLKGASGKRIYYRAERVDPKHLFIGRGPDTLINGRPHRLLNLSMSGIAALDHTDSYSDQDIGAVVPLELRVENVPLHEGHGEIVRVEHSYAGSRVALRLTDRYLNIQRLANQYKDYVVRRELVRGRNDQRALVSEDYKLLCTEALHLLRRYQLILSDWEQQNDDAKKDPRHGRELLDLSTEQLVPKWRHLSETANTYIDDFIDDAERLEAAKEFTELVLTPEMQVGPIWRRAYEKSLGYPGDYRVMEYVYSWDDQGETLYGKLVHRLGLDSLDCVASRMNMIQHIIAQEVINAPGTGQVSVTNLASGGAQEILNYVSQGHLMRSVRFNLVDQDYGALTHAYEQAFPHAIRHGGNAKLHCLHCSFTDLMKGGALSEGLTNQHLIYSVGLFDYLKTRRAEALLQTLYASLAPGGILVVGNLKIGPKAGRWAAEMICDWSMFYRTEAEMRSMARTVSSPGLQILTDRTDKIYLLCLRKNAAA